MFCEKVCYDYSCAYILQCIMLININLSKKTHFDCETVVLAQLVYYAENTGL